MNNLPRVVTWPGVEPTTSRSLVQHATARLPSHTAVDTFTAKFIIVNLSNKQSNRGSHVGIYLCDNNRHRLITFFLSECFKWSFLENNN